METTGIILAGGKSSRMGRNKALLEIDGKKVIERIVDELKHIVDHIIIVNNNFEEYEFLQLPMVKDKWQGIGPLAGIHAGLSASTTERNLIVACDMPFISSEIGSYLLKELADYDGVIPVIEGRMHPLFSAYRKNVKDVIEQLVEQKLLRITNILPKIHGKVVTEIDLKKAGFTVNEINFFNMNYPDNYEEAKKMVRKG